MPGFNAQSIVDYGNSMIGKMSWYDSPSSQNLNDYFEKLPNLELTDENINAWITNLDNNSAMNCWEAVAFLGVATFSS